MSKELGKYKRALEFAKTGLIALSRLGGGNSDGNEMARKQLEGIDAILNPPPVYEDVTVERWECDVCGGIRQTDPCNDLCLCHTTGEDLKKWTYTKLTGIRRVQVAQKVERSVSVEAHINGFGNVFSLNGDSLFSEHPEVHRKTGTLTFMVKE